MNKSEAFTSNYFIISLYQRIFYPIKTLYKVKIFENVYLNKNLNNIHADCYYVSEFKYEQKIISLSQQA
jgi:hypothetical protein